MRVYVLYLVIAALAIYAWRDWYLSLCGVIVLSAVMGHPDMPRAMFGIPGLNPWNFVFAAVAVPWLVNRRAEGIRWDMPPWMQRLVIAYLAIVFIAYLRAVMDIGSFPKVLHASGEMRYTVLGVTFDYLINPLKYILPGFMLYDGCRSRRRMMFGLAAALAMSAAYSFLVIRTVPISNLQQTGRQEMRQRTRIGKQVGFHANSVAMVCVAGSWGILATIGLFKKRWQKLIPLAASGVVALAVVLTRSRAGYVAFVGVGLVYAVFLWRWLLIALPALLATVCIAFPGVPQRLGMGFGQIDASGEETVNMNELTASRSTIIWPPVLDEITASPLIGHGRVAVLRTSVYHRLADITGGAPTHPHNAYLEMLIDGGLVSFLAVIAFYCGMGLLAIKLCRGPDPLARAVGAAGLAMLTTLAIMSMSGASLFPRENGQMGWCLYGLLARAAVEMRRALAPRPVAVATTPVISQMAYGA